MLNRSMGLPAASAMVAGIILGTSIFVQQRRPPLPPIDYACGDVQPGILTR